MDGENTTTSSPTHQIVRDVLHFLTMVIMLYTASLSAKNNEKIQNVEQKQTEVVVQQKEAAKKAEEVKDTLEDGREDDIKTKGVVLYSTWKYLEDVASHSGSKRDIDKAAESKKLYDAYVQKYDGKK